MSVLVCCIWSDLDIFCCFFNRSVVFGCVCSSVKVKHVEQLVISNNVSFSTANLGPKCSYLDTAITKTGQFECSVIMSTLWLHWPFEHWELRCNLEPMDRNSQDFIIVNYCLCSYESGFHIQSANEWSVGQMWPLLLYLNICTFITVVVFSLNIRNATKCIFMSTTVGACFDVNAFVYLFGCIYDGFSVSWGKYEPGPLWFYVPY